MITTIDLKRTATAVLENAYNIGYKKKENKLWTAQFTLPANDPKNEKVKLLQYVEIEDDITEEVIGLFRVMPKRTSKNSVNEATTYECEHVLGTLIGNTLFRYHQLTNYRTSEVVTYLLDQQKDKHWKLGTVELTRYFHYSWENENLLSALFSVPEPFDESYRWTWDTSSYPWTLNLVKPDTKPTARIIEGHNLLDIEIEENPMSLWNRIYPLGYGEGINQLDIKKVNNGIPYIEDEASIKEYGLYEYTWADRRYTDANSLKAVTKKMLQKWSEPTVSLSISAADLSVITGVELDKLKEGKVVRLILEGYPEMDMSILEETRSDITGDPGKVMLNIGNVQRNLGNSAADTERKQQVNELYSQGATNIMNFSYQDNCDSQIPALIPFYIDEDVVNVNTCELTFRTKRFRAYSQATKGGGSVVDSTSAGGATTKSTSSGGATTKSTTSGGGTTQTTSSGGSVSKSTSAGGGSSQTSSSGGGTSKSTNSGGGSSRTSSAGGDHRHEMFSGTGTVLNSNPDSAVALTAANGHVIYVNANTSAALSYYTAGSSGNHSHNVTVPDHSHDFSTPDHQHSVAIPAHAHEFEVPNHSHSLTIPSHSHDVTIPDHTHEIVIPNHTHEITIPNHIHEVEHKITELETTPSNVVIKVDGKTLPNTSTSLDRLDIVEHLSKDDSGKIIRGRHEIEITPNGLARIEADLILRVFIRSQLGGNF